MGKVTPACLPRLLLLRAGDVETNPGPRIYVCVVCQTVLTRRVCSVYCYGCHGWLHLKCSGLKSSKLHHCNFRCPPCSTTKSDSDSPQRPDAPAPSITPINDDAVAPQVATPRPSITSPNKTPDRTRTPETSPMPLVQTRSPSTVATDTQTITSSNRLAGNSSMVKCKSCQKTLTKTAWPVKCSKCGETYHLRCSRLRNKDQYSPAYVGPCCRRQLSPRPTVPSRTQQTGSTTHDPHTNGNPVNAINPPIVVGPSNMTQNSRNNGFKILQWNCNGLSRKVTEVTDYMDKKGILLAALQETKLSSRNPLTCSASYTVLRQDREKRGVELPSLYIIL